MTLLLGAIADDFTGATDLASMLVRQGMRTIQVIGVPDAGTPMPEADAVVVALKSRTIPASEAVAEALAALHWLQRAGARQILFKYCSTFDSTPAGNIGPVAEALMEALGTGLVVYCPALPENGRTIYRGHLFVGDQLLSESGMRHHPLTPMTDANLVRVLGRQTTRPVGLVPLATIQAGPTAIITALEALRAGGIAHAILDAVNDSDLDILGRALGQMPLVTGGSGIARGLPENFRRAGLLAPLGEDAAAPADLGGHAAVLAGSCSTATLAQVARFSRERPVFTLDPRRLAVGEDLVAEALAWARPLLGSEPILVTASAAPDQVAAIQEQLGREQAGALVEQALGRIAKGLVAAGVRRLVVAGGETSGAVVQALGIRSLRIGRMIDPGVPWTVSVEGAPLALALKSGNFGAEDFFLSAFRKVR